VIRLKSADDLYRAFTVTPSISATNLIDLYGVKYIISVIPIEGNRRFELIYSRIEGLQGRREDLLKENTIKLYRNRKPILRGWLVKDFRVVDDKAMLSRMTSKYFRPDREVLVEEEPLHPIPSVARNDKREIMTQSPRGGGMERGVEFISESNNRLDLQVKAAEDSLLVLSDTYYPGWKVFVDGKKTKIYRADYTFRAIPLDAGTHRVEFVYDPISFKLGAGVTILGILGCIGMGWIIWQKRSSRSGAS
jgi:hypothetical protein